MDDIVVAWSERRPLPREFVMASYSVMEPLKVMRVCRSGCCVDAGFGPQMLPSYWRAATTQEIGDCWWVQKDRARGKDVAASLNKEKQG